MSNVTYEIKEDYIAVITLNRKESANALSIALLDELNDCINRIENDHRLRSVIITGSGRRAFCAGADLKERKEMSDDKVIQTVQYIGHTVNRIEKIRIPVIAALNGVAFGGGLELSLACDIRIATNGAQFGLTETSLGIIPGAGGTQRLPRLIGLGHAKQLIYTATRINADEAYRLGLVEKVVLEEILMSTTLDIARRITHNGPIAVQLAKRAINEGMNHTLQTGLDIEWACYEETIPTEDRIEGLQAFNDKRKPKYRGK